MLSLSLTEINKMPLINRTIFRLYPNFDKLTMLTSNNVEKIDKRLFELPLQTECNASTYLAQKEAETKKANTFEDNIINRSFADPLKENSYIPHKKS